MSQDKGLFQRALSAIVEGRSRQAQRYVDAYLSQRHLNRNSKP